MQIIRDIREVMNSIGEDEKIEFELPAKLSAMAEECETKGMSCGTRVCQIELDCLAMVFFKEYCAPKYVLSDSDGNLFRFPDLSRFDEITIRYIDRVLPKTTSRLQRIRYNLVALHIGKHNQYAENAVTEIIAHLEHQRSLDSEERARHNFRPTNMAIICLDIMHSRLRSSEGKVLYEYWATYESIDSNSNGYLRDRHNLLEALALRRKYLDETQKKRLLSEIEDLYADALGRKQAPWIEGTIELSISYTKAEGLDFNSWMLKLGQHYEDLMNTRRNPADSQTMDYCFQAIGAYKDAGDDAKVDELTAIYEKIKHEFKPEGITIKLDQADELEQELKSRIEQSKSLHGRELLAFLSTGQDLIPSKSSLTKELKESASQTPLMSLVGRVFLDSSRNMTKKTEWGSEENFLAQLSEMYDFYMGIYYLPLIHNIIISGVATHRLTIGHFADFIRETAWYGQPHSIAILPPHIKAYDWLGQVCTIIGEYFASIEVANYNSEYQPHFQLCIDSLVLKFEGLLRCTAELAKIPVTKMVNNRDGQRIQENRNLNDLLDDERFERLLGEDTTLLLRWILIDKSGLYLRHKVGHSMMVLRDYSIDRLHLLFLALLRISLIGLKQENPICPDGRGA